MIDKKHREKILVPATYALLNPRGPWLKTPEERAAMTIACHDADNLPRVVEAGKIKNVAGVEVQVMHNGVVVKRNGYQGEWQADIIAQLKGVHEPQEEKVFAEVLKRIGPGGTMMELGSWWSYYSIWFVKSIKNGRAICAEPDTRNLELGKENARLNKLSLNKDISFYHAASGSEDKIKLKFKNEDGSTNEVLTRTIDSIIKEEKLEKLNLLHLDIQGAELDALKGAEESIKKNKIRFVFISTHHYLISTHPNLHQKCLDFVIKNGGHIIAKHTIHESFSGDGLIVASFDEKDKDFTVGVSLQHTDESLFRSPEEDVEILWTSYDKLLEYVKSFEEEMHKRNNQLQADAEAYKTRALLAELTPLRKHLKRSIKQHLSKYSRKLKSFRS